MDFGDSRDLGDEEAWVQRMQTKLHQWAKEHPGEALDDAWGLVTNTRVLAHAWARLAENKGSKTAGIDGMTRCRVEERGIERFIEEVRASLRSGEYAPLPVREHAIPKPDGKLRRLGIPTLKDRLVQMALKLVLEPLFEAEFQPCSYGFRPNRSTHDALAEIRHSGTAPRLYDWVVEGDIRACFDRIDHNLLMERVKVRVGDRKVLRLIRQFLEAGVLRRGQVEETTEGTPQGGVLSPLLANVLLDGLDRAYAERYHRLTPSERQRIQRKRLGPVGKLVRYADDFVVMIRGTQEDAIAGKGMA